MKEKHYFKRYGAIVLSLILLLSLFFPDTAWADQAEHTQEEQTTTFPVQAIHKTGDDRENFVIVINNFCRTQRKKYKAC